MGWAKPSQPGPVTGPSQWPGWAKQHACTKFTRVATLFKWIKIHLNSVMVIKAKREEDESWALFYSSVLLILLSQCLLGAGVGLFPCFSQPLILLLLLLLLHFHVSTVHMNSGDMEVQKKKKKRAPLVTGRKFSCTPLVTVL